MQHASASIHIDKSREQAWQILRKFGVAHSYVPDIIKTEITTEQKEGRGYYQGCSEKPGRCHPGHEALLRDW